jgi:hypothetical protein
MDTNTNRISHYIAGALRHPGTTIPANVTGECSHKHRSADAAAKCIAAHDAAIKRGHGRNAYSDRKVIAVDVNGKRTVVES